MTALPELFPLVLIRWELTLRDVFLVTLRAMQEFLLPLIQLYPLPHYSTFIRRQQADTFAKIGKPSTSSFGDEFTGIKGIWRKGMESSQTRYCRASNVTKIACHGGCKSKKLLRLNCVQFCRRSRSAAGLSKSNECSRGYCHRAVPGDGAYDTTHCHRASKIDQHAPWFHRV